MLVLLWQLAASLLMLVKRRLSALDGLNSDATAKQQITAATRVCARVMQMFCNTANLQPACKFTKTSSYDPMIAPPASITHQPKPVTVMTACDDHMTLVARCSCDAVLKVTPAPSSLLCCQHSALSAAACLTPPAALLAVHVVPIFIMLAGSPHL
jgi:hypothetical protein